MPFAEPKIGPEVGPEAGPDAGAELVYNETAAQPTPVAPTELTDPDPGAAATLAQGPENLQSLQGLSQRLEQNLAYLRTGVGAMPAEMVVYQVELEDLVAQVDAAISEHPDSSELWRQRVNLLMDLNQVYGAGLRRDEPFVASL
jgi:hypothetical protein